MQFRDGSSMSTRSLLQKALACAALATTGLAAQATTIDFEGTGAPSVFAATTPLTTCTRASELRSPAWVALGDQS